MANVNENERSHAIDLITEIELYLRTVNLTIQKAGGESTIKNSKSFNNKVRKVMFPDILLYSDLNKNIIIQGWEVKLPDVPVENTEFIKDAQYKADTLGLKSTVLWNFHSVVLYVKVNNEWLLYRRWNDLFDIKNRKDVEQKKNIWVKFLKVFLSDIDNFFRTGIIEKRTLTEITNSATTYIINDNKNILSTHLRNISKNDLRVEAWINQWWSEAKQEFLSDENDGYSAYSKVILMSWVTKIIFSHLIKETHVSANEVLEFDELTSPKDAINVFKNITEKSDFYTIFEYKKLEDRIPEEIWQKLLQFNSFYEDKVISHDILQNMLQNSVSTLKREVIGQFTTPEILADLLVNVTMVDVTGNDIDPCCGTGTIPKQIFLKKEELGMDELQIHSTVWASDKMQMALQIANMALTTPTSMNILNLVFKMNVFDILPHDKIYFTSPEDGSLIEKEFPKFNNIISNLPFVPFEIIDENDKPKISKIFSEVEKKTSNVLSSRSDYFMPIIFKFYELLEERGRLGIITSNSWLGTVSGKVFYKSLINFFHIDNVIVSGKGKWFKNADIVTTILVLEKLNESNKNNNIRFIKLNKAIEQITHNEVLEIGASLLLDNQHQLTSVSKYQKKEIDDLLEKNLSLNSLFHNVKWITSIYNKLTPLTSVFDVIRGERRGWDKLFYPAEENSIEPEYLEKVLKNSRNISTLEVKANGVAFCCSKSIEELENLQHFGAIEWIKRFENGVNKVGKPLPEVLTTNNLYWYEMLKEVSIAEFVTSINPERRLFWAKLEEPSFINQRLIGLRRNQKYASLSENLIMALLNSILGIFFIESSGFGRGLGALDINKKSLESTSMLSPDVLNSNQKKMICDRYLTLPKDVSQDIRVLLNTKEREEFDKFILKCYGIEEHYNEIKASVISMISTRLTVKE